MIWKAIASQSNIRNSDVFASINENVPIYFTNGRPESNIRGFYGAKLRDFEYTTTNLVDFFAYEALKEEEKKKMSS